MKILSSNIFDNEYKKVCKRNRFLINKVSKVITNLADNPSYNSLKTHIVNTPRFGKVFASTVTGDYRILWIFEKEDEIRLLSIGKHSGNSKVYRDALC